MKAISLWQPWASLWAAGVKIHETRHWATKHRGWLLVHAAKHRPPAPADVSHALEKIIVRRFGADWRKTLPYGSLIGAVNISACLATDGFIPTIDDWYCGNFGVGRFAWRAIDSKLFPDPVPYVGRQQHFTIPETIVKPLRTHIPQEIL